MKLHKILMSTVFAIGIAATGYAESGTTSGGASAGASASGSVSSGTSAGGAASRTTSSGATSGGVMGSGRATGSVSSGGGAFNSGRPTSPPTTLNSATEAQTRGAATLRDDLDSAERDGVESREGNRTTFDSPSERRTDLEDMDNDGISDDVDDDINTNARLGADVDANVDTGAGGVGSKIDLNTGVRVPMNKRDSNPGILKGR